MNNEKLRVKNEKYIDVGEDVLKFAPNNHAITLIALVITIIVLLILAGITINAIIGTNGLFGITQTAAEKTAVAELKEKADAEHLALKMQDYDKEVELSKIIEGLKKQGYTIVTKNSGGESKIIGITVNPETLMLNIEETNEIEITINREITPGSRYYAKMYNAYYEISLVKGEIKIRK